MATSAPSTLQNMAAFAKLLNPGGGTTTSTSTSSSGKTLSADAIKAMITQAYEDVNGLSAIGASERGSGGYNSSSSVLLRNNLDTNIATQVALANTPTVTTDTRTTTAPKDNSGLMALGLTAGAKLFESDSGKKLVKSGLDYLTSGSSDAGASNLGTAFDAASFSSYGDMMAGAADSVNTTFDTVGTYGGAAVDVVSDYGGSFLDTIGTGIGDAYDSVTSWFGFAEGGRVPQKENIKSDGAKGYAQGGTVTPRRSNAAGAYSEDVLAAARASVPGGVRSTAMAPVPGISYALPSGNTLSPDEGSSGLAGDLGGMNITGGYSYTTDRSIAREGLTPSLTEMSKMGFGMASPMGAAKTMAGAATHELFDQSPLEVLGALLGFGSLNDWGGLYATDEERAARDEAAAATELSRESARGAMAAAQNATPTAATATEQAGVTGPGEGQSFEDFMAEISGDSGDSWSSDPSNDGAGDIGTGGGLSEEGSQMAAAGGRIKGSRTDYAGGGPVRGDSNTGVDDVPAWLDGGEFVLTAAATKAIDAKMGPGFLEALNSLGMKGAK